MSERYEFSSATAQTTAQALDNSAVRIQNYLNSLDGSLKKAYSSWSADTAEKKLGALTKNVENADNIRKCISEYARVITYVTGNYIACEENNNDIMAKVMNQFG